jgi:hypothetical protein
MSTADVNKSTWREWAVQMRKSKYEEVPSISPVIKSLAISSRPWTRRALDSIVSHYVSYIKDCTALLAELAGLLPDVISYDRQCSARLQAVWSPSIVDGINLSTSTAAGDGQYLKRARRSEY